MADPQLSAHLALPCLTGRSVVLCAAGLAVKEPSTGVEFPLVRTFWVGEAQRNVGAGVRQKKIAFVGVKVRRSPADVPQSRRRACMLLHFLRANLQGRR